MSRPNVTDDVAEARAILRADEALGASYELTFDTEERDAWERLVARANNRIAEHEGRPISPFEITPYPGGNEPDFQTLMLEAVAASERKRTR